MGGEEGAGDLDEAWAAHVAKRRAQELNAIIEDENLKPDETRAFIETAFRDGEIKASLLWAILGLFVGVAILRAVGIVARRLGAGVMQYRMQAHTRRAVTRRYLELPMEWHQKHPTGELLSNANSDVEAAWGPIAPLPMAVGTVAMMVIAVAQMFLADLVLAMDRQSLADLGGPTDRIRLFRDFDPVEPGGEVPDPYYGGDSGFEEVLSMVERTAAALVAELGQRTT